MKTGYVSLIAALGLFLSGCSDSLESGKGYPSLETGDETLVFHVDKVLQNNQDVKPYFTFFDGVELRLGYKDNRPDRLTLSESGAPFSVTAKRYEEVEWEICTAKSPYEIRERATGEVICYITRDRRVTFPFRLGAPSNSYEYQLVPAQSEATE